MRRAGDTMFCARDTTVGIRITPERYDVPILAVLAPLIWVIGCLIVWLMGCAAKTDVTGVDVSKTSTTTTTTTVPVSIEDVQGDVTVITLAGATPWTIAGLVGLLGLFQARRQSTATGAVDRVMLYLKLHRAAARREENFGDAKALKAVTRGIEAAGTPRGKPDRLERCIRSRLARMKK
ncbi:hypothetical protein LCGC14_2405230 [marine sediment metagenome]|uniref:Uncharacterized protein n=1 Tax=marine sediment metagenome TaxID=412755 RepID=A0A0F9CG63_9ZZZZ